MRSQLKKLTTGLAGEYAVAAEMNLHEWVASLSLKNYPGVDIFGLNPKMGNKTANIQVKTSVSTHFYTGIKHSEVSIDDLNAKITGPYVFVYAQGNSLKSMSFYVLSRSQVINLIMASDDKYYYGTHNRKVPKDDYSVMLYIGRDGLEQYENKWENLWMD